MQTIDLENTRSSKLVLRSRAHIRTAVGLAALAWTLVGGAAHAQEIHVLEEGGAKVDAGGKTTLTFRSDEPLTVHRVLEQTNIVVMGDVNASGSGMKATRLCATPCTVEVPNGSFRLRAGDGAITDAVFDVRANNGSQQWMLKAGRPGRFILGAMLAGFALIPAIYGGVALAMGPGPGLPGKGVSVPVFVGGAGLTAVGFAMSLTAGGSATLESSTP